TEPRGSCEAPLSTQEQLARETRFEFYGWWGIFAGPIAWAMDEGFSYSVVQHACSTGHFYVLYAATAVFISVALSGFFVALKSYLRFPQGELDGGKPHDRAQFQGILGMIFSLGFLVVILALGVPHWLLSPCS